MTTLEMNQARVDLAREILSTDNVELINTLCRAARRFAKRQVSKQTAPPPCQYTTEEMRTRAVGAMSRYEQGEYISNEEVINSTQRWK